MNNCAPFQAYTEAMRDRGYHQFVIDLSSCPGLDSTFLGLLASLATDYQREPEPSVVLLNTLPGVLRSLSEIGIHHVVTVCDQETRLPDIPLKRLQEVVESPIQRAERMLRAHEQLCEIHGQNLEKFGLFIELLRAELAEHARREGVKPIPLGLARDSDP